MSMSMISQTHISQISHIDDRPTPTDNSTEEWSVMCPDIRFKTHWILFIDVCIVRALRRCVFVISCPTKYIDINNNNNYMFLKYDFVLFVSFCL